MESGEWSCNSEEFCIVASRRRLVDDTAIMEPKGEVVFKTETSENLRSFCHIRKSVLALH